MPTLDEGSGSKFLGTNLDSFEANWILELDQGFFYGFCDVAKVAIIQKII
jgi:hypothetical protein